MPEADANPASSAKFAQNAVVIRMAETLLTLQEQNGKGRGGKPNFHWALRFP